MLSERDGCTLLTDVFTARGYAIARDVHFDERGLRFDIDGWDAASRVGFEFRTHEAGDHLDLSDAELGELAQRMEANDLFVFVIDDLAVDDENDLRSYAHRFLDEVQRRRNTGATARYVPATGTKKNAAKKTAAKKTAAKKTAAKKTAKAQRGAR